VHRSRVVFQVLRIFELHAVTGAVRADPRLSLEHFAEVCILGVTLHRRARRKDAYALAILA
jgi:hypothetical protein